jgi:O-antigen ligase
VSLVGGLTVLAAIGPFTEALTDEGRITAVPFLLAALGLGVLVEGARLLMRRGLSRPPAAVLLAGVLFGVTLLGVGLSALSFGPQRGIEALQLWVPGIGGGLTVLVAAWLVGRAGEVRPLIVLLVSITLAAGLTTADVLLNGVVRATAFEWLLRSDVGPGRLTGIIPAPNAAAVIFLVGLAGCAAFAILGRPAQARLMAMAAAAVLVAAIFLTYSRSALLALAVMAAVLAWHWHGWRALAGVLAVGAAAVAVALTFPQLGLSREVPFWADEARLAAWAATGQMWLDQPLVGHGFRSFEWLHGVYGSSLDAPHNEWIRLFAEGGLVAGVVGLGLLAATLAALSRKRTWVAVAAAAGLAGFAVMASFNNPLLYVQVNVPAFLLLGMGISRQAVAP